MATLVNINTNRLIYFVILTGFKYGKYEFCSKLINYINPEIDSDLEDNLIEPLVELFLTDTKIPQVNKY